MADLEIQNNNNNQRKDYLEFVETIPAGLDFPPGIKTYPSIGGKVLEMIKACETTIKAISFYYELRRDSSSTDFGAQIYEQLIQAAKRGVHIKFIANICGQWRTNQDILDLNEQFPESVEYRFIDMSHKTEGYVGGICHTKAWIFDDTKFYVGSANMDWRAYDENVNTGFIGENRSKLMATLKNIFEVCWNINSTDDNVEIYQGLSEESENSPIKLSTSPNIVSKATQTLADKDALLDVINNAKITLCIGSYMFTPFGYFCEPHYFDYSIEHAIVNAATLRKVQVSILVDHKCIHNRKSASFLRRLMQNNGIIIIKTFNGRKHVDPNSDAHTKILHLKMASSESRVWNSTNNIDPSYFLCTAGIGVNVDATNSKQSMPLVAAVNDHYSRYWNSKYADILEERHLTELHPDLE